MWAGLCKELLCELGCTVADRCREKTFVAGCVLTHPLRSIRACRKMHTNDHDTKLFARHARRPCCCLIRQNGVGCRPRTGTHSIESITWSPRVAILTSSNPLSGREKYALASPISSTYTSLTQSTYTDSRSALATSLGPHSPPPTTAYVWGTDKLVETTRRRQAAGGGVAAREIGGRGRKLGDTPEYLSTKYSEY